LKQSEVKSVSPRSQLLVITLAALTLSLGVYLIPHSHKLSHLDFSPKGANSVQFCDPDRPRVIAVENRIPRVTIAYFEADTLKAGKTTHASFGLYAASGKPIGLHELTEGTNQNFQIILVSPYLDDVQLIEPYPISPNGRWAFDFKPTTEGNYRIFADITPEATQAEIYTSTNFPVSAGEQKVSPAATHSDLIQATLIKPTPILYAGQPYELCLILKSKNHEMITVIPSLGSFAHLIVIDKQRTSFINAKTDPQHVTHSLDSHSPEFFFNISLPDPGTYTVWAEVNISGTVEYYSFPLTVEP